MSLAEQYMMCTVIFVMPPGQLQKNIKRRVVQLTKMGLCKSTHDEHQNERNQIYQTYNNKLNSKSVLILS